MSVSSSGPDNTQRPGHRCDSAASPPIIINTMISDADQRLIANFASRLKWNSVAVSALRRFGFSDAYLYVLRPIDGSGQPHVAKIGPTGKIVRERNSWLSVRGFLEMDDVIYNSDAASRRSGLCFRLKSKTGLDTDIVELDDYYREALDGDQDAKGQLTRLLAEVYESMSGAHHPTEPETQKTYGSLFRKYLRPKVSPNRVGVLFRSHGTPLDMCGYVVPEDPLKVLPAVLRRICRGYYAAAIHGDLHLSNVVVSRSRPHLVDYAWANLQDHLAKDFVLMESSLRFMRFPQYIHPRVLLDIDSELNSHWEVDHARSVIDPTLDSAVTMTLTCMLDVVAEVRRRFASAVSVFSRDRDQWLREYYTCLYLILAGQQRFNSFPLLRTTVNLHQLRSWTQVEKTGTV